MTLIDNCMNFTFILNITFEMLKRSKTNKNNKLTN